MLSRKRIAFWLGSAALALSFLMTSCVTLPHVAPTHPAEAQTTASPQPAPSK